MKFFLLATIAFSAVISLFFEQRIDPYYLQVIIFAGIHITLAVGLNLINGHTGQFSLGHAGFTAIGAYVAASVTIFLFPAYIERMGDTAFSRELLFFIALLLGGCTAALLGLGVGIPSLRLHGDYLAIATLGFGEIVRVVLQNTDAVGGSRGLTGIPPYTNIFWTYSVAAITVYTVAMLVNSTYGRGFLAVRDDEIAAEAMGINTTKYKVMAFAIGAFFAGIGGGLYAHSVQYINPEGFNFLESVEIVVMVILGGMGNTIGVVLAAVFLTLLNELLRGFAEYRMIVYALLLIILMILRPQGLLGDIGPMKRWLLRWAEKQR